MVGFTDSVSGNVDYISENYIRSVSFPRIVRFRIFVVLVSLKTGK